MASIYKWLNNKKRLSIYLTTFSNFSKAIVLYFATVFLYKIDNSGASSGFLVLLGLLAVSLSGMIAPFLITHFKGFKLGILLSMVSLVTEFLFFIFYQQKILLYCCIVVINLIQGIESANYNYELVDIFENDVEDQIQSNNGYHILLQTFTLIAPILGYLLVNYCIILVSCVVVLFLQLIALISWFILKKYEPLSHNVDITKYPFKNYLLAVKNKNVVFLNLVRSANGFVFNTWEIAAPMVIMAIAENQAQLSSKIQTMYETTLSIAFILSGAFLGKIMTNVKLLPRFYKLVPFGGLLATIIALSLQTMSSLLLATLIFGVSVYFFRVGTATIGQIITDKDLIAESIILGDVFTRFVNFVVGIGFFFIIKFLDYKIVVILISILGTIGNVLFVDQPIKAYSDLIKSRGSL